VRSRAISYAATALAAILSVLPAAPRPARACDLCSIFTATEMQESRPGWRVSLAEQFSRHTTIIHGGDEVANLSGQRLESSITQAVLAYQIGRRLGVQAAVPYIHRSYRRAVVTGVQDGEESGLGDVSVVARALLFGGLTESGMFRVWLLGGVKLPTGDAERLGDEVEDHEGTDAAAARVTGRTAISSTPLAPNAPAHEDNLSEIHGHDIALGSGSVDYVVGAEFFGSWKRLFVGSTAQQMIRTKGDFDYDYGSDFLWSAGPGAYVWLAHTHTLALQAAFSGEVKATDKVGGHRNGGTAVTSIYLGPALRFTLASSLSIEASVDFPIVQNPTGRQLVPDYRFRSGLTWGL